MYSIDEILHQIDEEIKAAKCYAKSAIYYKDSGLNITETYISLSNAELEHVERLNLVAKKVLERCDENDKLIWEWQHKRNDDRIAHIKIRLSMAR